MNGSLVLVALCLASPVLAQTGQTAKATNVPEIPFESVPNFLQMPPDVYLGETMGVARNSKGNLWVVSPQRRHAPVRVRPAGKFVREWGVGIYGFEFAHKVRVDRTTTSGPLTRGRTWSSSSTPKARS